jgi:uncharacterized protein YrrD
MEEVRDVLPVGALVGMTVLSRATGNKLGEVRDLFIDPANGVMQGLELAIADGSTGRLPYDEIYSFGRDAIMARSDSSIMTPETAWPAPSLNVSEHLIGTKIFSESGQSSGNIANVFVTLQPPPFVIYEIRDSILDKLLGREFFILASSRHALSNDSERLVVPDDILESASSDMSDLINQELSVRTFHPKEAVSDLGELDIDDTVVVLVDEDETIVRDRDEDETIVRRPGNILPQS